MNRCFDGNVYLPFPKLISESAPLLLVSLYQLNCHSNASRRSAASGARSAEQKNCLVRPDLVPFRKPKSIISGPKHWPEDPEQA